MSQNSSNKMTELIQAYDLRQLVQEPTHYTENSSSVIDLILIRNISNVLTTCVTDCFLPVLKETFKRLIWNYNLADYDLYRTLLSEHNLVENLNLNEDIDENVKCITDAIFLAAEQSIPNKTITVRPAEHPWITCKIKNHIRKRKRYYRKFKNRKCFVFGKVQRHTQ